MIGGTDIVIEGRPDDADREVLVRALRAAWPDGLVADATTNDEPRAVTSFVFPFALPDEFLAYENRLSFESWEAEGATSTNADSMLHFLFGETSMTCVVHAAADSSTAGLVKELIDALVSVRLRSDGSEYGKVA